MAKIKTRKVKILSSEAGFVTLLFIEQHCKIKLPLRNFRHRLEMGLYEVINPAILKKPAV